MEEILRIQNLSKRYGDMPVLDHVDLSVKKGEVVVIVGPSGCGKSTFLRGMNALEEIQEGKVLLDGELINPCRGKLNLVRQRIGMVFQSYELFPHKTVLQNMTLAPVRVKKKDRREAEEEAREMTRKIQRSGFDFDDYLKSMKQLKKLGGLSKFMGLLPNIGITGKMKSLDINSDETEETLKRNEAIIYSMTPKERSNPDLLNPSRKKRIADGSGVDISEVNRLVKQFDQARRAVKQMPGLFKGGKGGRKGMFGKMPLA